MYEANSIRGSIKFIDRYKQLISFEGLERHRHITPMDIDGFIDYAGNAFFYMECKLESKYIETGLDMGQKYAIEHIIDAHIMANKMAAAIIFIHNSNPDEIIMARDMIVKEFYFDHKWRMANDSCTVLDAIEWFEKHCKKLNIYI